MNGLMIALRVKRGRVVWW